MSFRQIFRVKKTVLPRLTALAALLCLFTGLLAARVYAAPDQPAEPEYTEFEQLNGSAVGMITGAPFEELIRSKVPEVGSILYFNSATDLMTALKAGKVEAYLMNNAVGALQVNQDRSLAVFPHKHGHRMAAPPCAAAAAPHWAPLYNPGTNCES